MSEAANLRQLAEKCRNLARQIGDQRAKDALAQLAASYDEQADKVPVNVMPTPDA